MLLSSDGHTAGRYAHSEHKYLNLIISHASISHTLFSLSLLRVQTQILLQQLVLGLQLFELVRQDYSYFNQIQT